MHFSLAGSQNSVFLCLQKYAFIGDPGRQERRFDAGTRLKLKCDFSLLSAVKTRCLLQTVCNTYGVASEAGEAVRKRPEYTDSVDFPSWLLHFCISVFLHFCRLSCSGKFPEMLARAVTVQGQKLKVLEKTHSGCEFYRVLATVLRPKLQGAGARV